MEKGSLDGRQGFLGRLKGPERQPSVRNLILETGGQGGPSRVTEQNDTTRAGLRIIWRLLQDGEKGGVLEAGAWTGVGN